MAGVRGKGLFLGISVFGSLLTLIPGPPTSLLAQFATSDRVSQPGFWPTQTKYSRDEYTGAQSCAECHKRIFETQRETSMARTAMRASESDILSSNPELSFSHGNYHYSIQSSNGGSIYLVADGMKQQTAMLVWAFGTNRVAQSYLFKKSDSEFYEARVTYFRSLGTLDFTPGRAVNSPQDLEEAMDRQVGRAEVYRCFACHTTGSGMGSGFDESKLIPGISCEACHGPGRGHVAEMEGIPTRSTAVAVSAADMPEGTFNPKKLTPEESVDFCGSCHGSYWDVSLSGASGVGNVRFQPFRLEESKCWNKNDARLTCVACHDPHKQVETDTASYDHVCLSCHLTKGSNKGSGKESGARQTAMSVDKAHPSQANQARLGAACPVAQRDCASCHMPQIYVPTMHSSFADHRIHIAREGEPFPD
jgi:hypothetical protein